MDREQIAKAAVAAGIFALVVVAVFSLWFVLPSMRSGDEALAQEEAKVGAEAEGKGGPPAGAPEGMPGAPQAGAPGAAPGPGAPSAGGPGAPPGAGAAPAGPGMGMMAGGAGPAAPAPPLEPSRANPFAPIDTSEPELNYRTTKTKYGPDWSKVPIGYFTTLPQPQIPAAPAPPLPPNPTPLADLVRVSSVVWPQQDIGAGAPGRAYITWEDPQGRTRIAGPGSQITVEHPDTKESQSWRVVAIQEDAVILRNTRTGEEARMPVKPRSRAETRYWGGKQLSDEQKSEPAGGRLSPGAPASSPGEGGVGGGAGPGAAMGGMGGAGGMPPGAAGGMGPGMGPGAVRGPEGLMGME